MAKSLLLPLLLLLLLAGLYAGALSGLSRVVNGWIYDPMAAIHRLIEPPPPAAVLHVDARRGAGQLNQDGWIALHARLLTMGARAVVLNRPPPTAPALEGGIDLLIGVTAEEYQEQYSGWQAITAAPPVDYGIHRDQLRRLENGLPLLESAAAARAGIADALEGQPYRVDLGNAQHGLPRIDLERLAGEGMLDSMVAGRVVLIDLLDPAAPRLFNPRGGDGLTLGEFQALALDTLLNRQVIQPFDHPLLIATSGTISAMLLVAILIVTPVRIARTVVIAVSVLTLITILILLILFHFWLPPAEILLAQIVVWLIYRERLVRQADEALRDVALESAANLEARWLPQDFYASDGHWKQVAMMLEQTLSLRRLMLLERVAGDHRVREVMALHCAIDDIGEMRRDYERTPYTTAISAGGPILLHHPYLRVLADDDEEEEQYLVPLIFAGDMLGFWAFGVRPVAAASRQKWIELVARYADQVAELLYHRDRWRKRRSRSAGVVAKLLRIDIDQPGYRSVRQSLTLLNRRLQVMESLLNSIDSAVILYDLFGRVIHVNQPMERRLQGESVAPFEMTAADLVSGLTGSTLDEARGYINHLILNGGTITLQLRATTERLSNELLTIRPIYQPERGTLTDPQPFDIMGLLIELINVSRVHELLRIKEQLMDEVGSRFRNDMEAVSMACSLIRNPLVGEEAREEIYTMIGDKVTSALAANDRIHHLLGQELTIDGKLRYPVDLVAPLRQLLVEREEELRHRRLRVRSDLPPLLGLVFAAPGQLGEVIAVLFDLLISDAVDESTIVIGAVNYGGHVILRMNNSGFGLPNERLQEYISGDAVSDESGFARLRWASRLVNEWGGELVARSVVGGGINLTLSLESFSSSAPTTRST
jgi:hypothetical protein